MTDPYADMTVMHPVMAALLLLLSILVLRLPRKYAIVPFIIAMNFIPNGERLYALGMNFTAMRILVVVGLARIFLRREAAQLRVTTLDRIVALYAVATVAAHVLLYATFGSLVAVLGITLDKFGAYIVVRLLVRDLEEVRTIVRVFAIISIPICLLLFYDWRTGQNSFGVFGGVPNALASRGGSFRARGPYAHPILAGAIWASVLPLIIAYRFRNGKRSIPMYLSMMAIILIVMLTGSSTPAMSLAVAIAGSIMYYQRELVPLLAKTAVLGIVALAIFWWHPVWYLFTKINVTGHSTSNFRFLLVDGFVRHWRDWFLVGARSSYGWSDGHILGGAGLADQSNQFVAEGAKGGFLALALFVSAIVVEMRYLGRLVSVSRNDQERRAYWYMGLSILVHITSFMGVHYFGQEVFLWSMIMAICSSLYCSRILSLRANRRSYY